jgi:hypothetical protein
MGCETSARSAANAVLAVKLNIQRVESVATRRKRDTNAVVEAAAFGIVDSGFVLRFVQLEANLREIVELGNGVAGNLCLNTTFDDRVEQGVDMRLLGEVNERLGVFGSLDCEILVSI